MLCFHVLFQNHNLLHDLFPACCLLATNFLHDLRPSFVLRNIIFFMMCLLSGLGVRVWGLGFRVWDLGFGVPGLGVWDLGFGV